ncbi:hypothetical protein CYLTODRAFT_495344 [Cylindrobasidium torrendii FP15055 ss-10]|uniref:Uncharacterized protein n=1 Tax=Cylindrobasidium torrendii FP15055 ss-10 TaxID=1314674 RepID=A0A0D7ATU4_9AGAR|nr:hypothetical protein CYLTODRAFT_495344 [Cylindrobasidium torrendii FP15055 ss-10]
MASNRDARIIARAEEERLRQIIDDLRDTLLQRDKKVDQLEQALCTAQYARLTQKEKTKQLKGDLEKLQEDFEETKRDLQKMEERYTSLRQTVMRGSTSQMNRPASINIAEQNHAVNTSNQNSIACIPEPPNQHALPTTVDDSVDMIDSSTKNRIGRWAQEVSSQTKDMSLEALQMKTELECIHLSLNSMESPPAPTPAHVSSGKRNHTTCGEKEFSVKKRPRGDGQ